MSQRPRPSTRSCSRVRSPVVKDARLRCLALAGLMVLTLVASHGRPGQALFRPGERRADGAECLLVPSRGASAQNPLYADAEGTLVFTLFHRGYNRGPAGLFCRSARGGGGVALLDEEDVDSVNMPGSAIRGGKVVFASDREEREEIWTLLLGPGSGLPRRVTRHGDRSAWREPTWSPDGRWIVFERNEAGAGAASVARCGSVWKVRTDGSGLVRLSPGPLEGFDDSQPNWSPAGGAIVFQRRRVGSEAWNLHVMDDDGGHVRPLTHGDGEDTDAAWSPDGRRVVFSSSREGADGASLYVMDAGGGGARRLTHDAAALDAAPCWSLDGAWIAFESRRAGEVGASLWRHRVQEP